LELKNIIKWILQANRLYFYYINLKYHLKLDFQDNKNQIAIFKDVFYHKTYETGFPNGLQNGVIVDIGAHYGFFTLYAVKHVASNSKIYAVEPSGSNFTRMQANLNSSTQKQVFMQNIGISGTTGIRTLFQSKPQNHSIFSHYIDGMRGGTQVRCLSLKDFMDENKIEKIDFLKNRL
jgi:FkbM family methyltransferase